MEGQVPTGVKIISVLYYIGAGLSILFGLLFLVGAGFMGILASQIPLLGLLGSGLFVVVGIVVIGLGVLSIFIGRGLWKGKNWARIVAIIFSVLGILSGLYSIVKGSYSSLLGMVINLVIGGYLMFNSAVKSAFSS